MGHTNHNKRHALWLTQGLAEALDDPKRDGYPWEHLGDAERDVRALLAALRDAQTRLADNERYLDSIRNGYAYATERLAQADKLADALRRMATMEGFVGAVDLRFADAEILKSELGARQAFARAALDEWGKNA